jgi:hypothetical protein
VTKSRFGTQNLLPRRNWKTTGTLMVKPPPNTAKTAKMRFTVKTPQKHHKSTTKTVHLARP